MILPPSLRGIVAMVVAMGALIANDTCMKLALADAPLFHMVLIRGIAATALLLALIVAQGMTASIPRIFNPWLAARGLCEVVANVSFTFAITYMPIADLTAIAQTCPLLVLLGAWLLWGEKLGTPRLALVGLGIAGALLVAQPGATAASPFAVLGFVTALAAAARDLMTRKVPGAIPAPVGAFTVVAALTLTGAIGTALVEQPTMPDFRHVALTGLAGVFLVTGQVCIFLAYRIGPVRSVAPFMYTLTIWAVLSGYFVFGDIPNLTAIAGMALVALAGLLIIWLETRKRSPPSLVAQRSDL